MEAWLTAIPFEKPGPVRRALRTVLFSPIANYTPTGLMKAVLRLTKSELAAANWVDPGGWRSMRISYDAQPRQWADKVLVGAGAMSMALRNRRRLAGAWVARLIDAIDAESVHVVGLGAGPGQITIDALLAAKSAAHATLIDRSAEAFEHGRRLAKQADLADRVAYIQGDVLDIEEILNEPPSVVTMLGLCEYLTDEQIVSIASTVGRVMSPGTAIVVNSISKAHGTDRFFRRVFGLHLIHRSEDEIRRLMASAGFVDFVSHREPLGVYHVMVGRRP